MQEICQYSNGQLNICMIIAAGCSHLFGSDLDDVRYPLSSPSVWPELVARHLGTECHNISIIAAGNQGIFRRVAVTLESLINIKKINPQDITLFVQFSHWDRHEYLHRDFVWAGADFPYVTSKFIEDSLISDSKKIFNIIKQLLTPTDPTYMYLINLQFAVLTYLYAEKMGVQMFSTWVQMPELTPPAVATVGDTKIGLSFWDQAHQSVAANSFDVTENHGLLCYHPQQQGLVFDAQTLALASVLDRYQSQMLTFDQHSNWMDFCRSNKFSFKKQMWEQGDTQFRAFSAIKKIFNGNDREGNGHWGEDAHKAAAFSIIQQLSDRGIT